ncbi:hypothetical protein D3C87_1626870 [compost metagenome]
MEIPRLKPRPALKPFLPPTNALEELNSGPILSERLIGHALLCVGFLFLTADVTEAGKTSEPGKALVTESVLFTSCPVTTCANIVVGCLMLSCTISFVFLSITALITESVSFVVFKTEICFNPDFCKPLVLSVTVTASVPGNCSITLVFTISPFFIVLTPSLFSIK